MRHPFKGLVIAKSGEFGSKKSDKDFERWITNAGGKYAKKVTEEVTHLICHVDDWKHETEKGEC
jgi:twin BRCT domain